MEVGNDREISQEQSTLQAKARSARYDKAEKGQDDPGEEVLLPPQISKYWVGQKVRSVNEYVVREGSW